MTIKHYEERLRLQIKGKIRLGEKRVEKKGAPVNLEYFVLKDAPEVKKFYGEEPTLLHVRFVYPARELAAPYFYTWYTGGYVKDGVQQGGDCQCRGDGEVAQLYAARDPITGIVPTRKCMGEECPDFAKGCKATMYLYVHLPLISEVDLYQISTKSKYNISHVQSTLKLIEDKFGRIDNFNFKMTRKTEEIEFYERKEKRWTKTKQSLIKLDYAYSFEEEFREQLEKSQQYLLSAQSIPKSLPPVQIHEYGEPPLEIEHTPEVFTWSEEDLRKMSEEETVVKRIEVLATKNWPNTPQNRFLAIKRFENASDPKAELISYLDKKIEDNAKALQNAGAQTQ